MGFSLGSFAGGLAPGISPQTLMAIQQQVQQRQGNSAFGDALAQMYGGAQPSAPGAPGGAPQGQPSSMPPMAGPGAMGPTMPGQPPMMQSGGPPPSPIPAAPVAQPQPGPSLPPAAPMQPSMGAPGGSGGPPGMPPPQPQGGPQPGQPPMGMMTLPDLVQGIMKAKPGIKGQALASAVTQAIPLMNAQGMQQWRQLQGTLGMGRLENQTANTQSEVQSRAASTDIKQKSFDERVAEFQTRQAGVNERFDRTIDEKLTALASTKDRATAGQLATDVRAAITAKQAATRAQIQAANAFDENEKPKLEAAAAQEADEAAKRLDDALKAQRSFSDQTASKSKPEAAKADGSKDDARAGQGDHKVGETIPGPGGKQYRYKGGDWDAQESWEPVK